MNEQIKFDYVGTQPCGCKVTFKAGDVYVLKDVVSCKEHDNENGRDKVITKARENLNELLNGRKE